MNFSEQAIKHAKSRQIKLPKEYYALENQQLRGLVFSVAGIDSSNIIAKVLETLVQNLESGQTFNDWQKKVKEENLLNFSKNRLDIIYQTNIQAAFNAGNSEYIYSNDLIYACQYDAVKDSRTRQTHKAWNGYVAPKDDEFWLTHTPACGYRCRCRLIPLTKFTAEKRIKAWNESRQKLGLPKMPEGMPDKGWDYDKRIIKKDDKLKYLEIAKKEAEDKIISIEKKLGILGKFSSIVINFFKKIFK